MKALKLVAAIALATTASSAFADNVVTNGAGQVFDGGKTIFQTITHPAAVSAEVGTLGYGASASWSVNDSTELQAGWTGGNHSFSNLFSTEKLNIGNANIKDIVNLGVVDEINADIRFTDLTIKASNPYLGVQLRPLSNWLTVGTGVVQLNNEINAKATLKADKQSVVVNGQNYTLNDVSALRAKVKLNNKLAPYLTVGLRPNLNSRFGIFGEVGAAYAGKPIVTIDTANKANGIVDSFAQKLVNDAQTEVDKTTSKIKYPIYPIVKVGATLRF